ncbi:MAG: lysine--tRNA ligase [Candidatus Spechtbacteria bacterium RIFCSPHIGHO2_02_FULL_43_15b]|uniref:Lysine--tRNA ligase n=1 Tax=Candidatus Spechtbacteria bacterium RIFCSPHIGHO2_01_FULL_43_30 TaxID=1802158 RepID=A0A1G2H8K0_9BACT|nr:MAG: lysine--tRNA ligase [Candidatus Spechtbacteria bacterium RIFCSPHIGHO2_01_FULL_43_30]OGZ60332.1 MAG: lysine--tRNA ligase [Candidatus Spechtbacteria bacterium RIFCSPHIGHO2_02_FULL_43_15b]
MPLDDIRKIHIAKKESLERKGQNAYPISAKRTHTCEETVRDVESLLASEKEVILCGRIMALREHGGSTFAHIADGTGKFQIYAKKDSLGEAAYKEFLELFDIGDIVQARGVIFRTRRGEATLEVADVKMLSKSILPLPEKWHGLKDTEERYRKRYIDLLMNEEVREIFEIRSKIVKATREFLDSNGFLEVETSILQQIPGGASAKPFKTHLNALGMDLYLRVAPELDLKKLLVGGIERVYEIGRSFRNEGMDHSHNPEFTSLEFYCAYMDYKELMKFSEKLFEHIFRAVGKYPVLKYDDTEINLSGPWPRIEFAALFEKYLNIKYDDLNRDSLAKEAEKFGIKSERHLNKGQIGDLIYKKALRQKLVEPTFVIHHPAELAPLAKPLPDNPKYDARFQLIVNGWELVNAFSELNDPFLQRELFEAQEKQLRAGDEEAQRLDESFVEALEYGMPPAAGFAFGVDRLTALLTNSHSLREVILFPTMRPR